MSVEPDEDGDVPAVEGNMEPADEPGGAPTHADEPDVPDPFAGGADAVLQRKPRVISKKARELFKTAADKLKAQLKDDDEEFTNGVADAEPEAAAAAEVKAEPAEVAPKPAEVVVPPPAPSLDPAIEQHKQRLDMRASELDAREKQIVDREKAVGADFDGLRDTYYDKPSAATVAFIRRMIGAGEADDITEEVADLITQLSGDVLKVPLSPEIRSRLESKLALKSVKAQKQQLTKREQEIEARRVAAAEKDERVRAISSLGAEMQKEERAKEFPFLAAEDNAGELVFEVIEAQHKRDQSILPWTEAAKRANDYLSQQWRRAYDKRRPLLSAAPDKEPPKPAEAIVPQGDPSGIRRSHTITNAASAATATSRPRPPAPAVDANGKWNREAHRAQTMAKMRQAFKEHPPDE